MKTNIEDIASEDLVAALEANMIAFWSAYGRANQCTLHATSELVWFYTGVPFPLFNGVPFAQLKPNKVKAAVDSLQAKIRQQGAPALWWIGPLSQPAHLGALLEGYGLHPAGEVPGMAIELAGIINQVDRLPDFTIQKVTTKELQAVWARTAAVGTGFSDSATHALVQLEASLDETQYQGQQHYLGLLDGVPIATSALTLDAGVAGIYAVATIPAARGRGIGRAMTVIPLLEARQLGYRIGILQASDMGYPLYRKIGFQEMCRYRLYLQSA
jgi:GNAT superfamily N-acetyltransferase